VLCLIVVSLPPDENPFAIRLNNNNNNNSVSQNCVNINLLFLSGRWTYAMGDRLTMKQRRAVTSLMEVYGSPTVVRQKLEEQFAGRDLPSQVLT
jgi:hypothetical protein